VTGPGDAGLAYWQEHREQLRQSENQRAVLTNFVLVIAAAVSSLVVQQHFAVRTLPLSVLVVVTGLYGAVTVAKYHERAEYHLQQARALTQALTTAGVLADYRAVLQDSRDEHYRRYPRLHRIRLNRLWTGLHLGIAGYGAALIIITAIAG
jgi:hypothetical protein